MIVAFGTSTPTSITVVATSTSSSPLANASMILGARSGPQPAVQAADPEAFELRAAQALRLCLGRLRLDRLGRRDERADDECLPPVGEVAAQPRVGLASALVADPARDDGLATGGKLVDLGHREVPQTVSASVRGIGVAVMWRR